MAFTDVTKEVQCSECSYVFLPFRNGLVRSHRNIDVSPARAVCGGTGKMGREPVKGSEERRKEIASAVLAAAPRGTPHSSAAGLRAVPAAQEKQPERRHRVRDILSRTERASIEKRAKSRLAMAERMEKKIQKLKDERQQILEGVARLHELLS